MYPKLKHHPQGTKEKNNLGDGSKEEKKHVIPFSPICDFLQVD